MKVYPIYCKEKYSPSKAILDAHTQDVFADALNKCAEKERQKLSQFCEQKRGSDRYGDYVLFEFNGSLEEFYTKYNGEFVVFTNTEGEMSVSLKNFASSSIHDGQ